jgi:hypothetical protein
MRGRRRARIGVLLLGLVAAAACGKREEQPAPARAPAISAPERQQATDACNAYVAKLCACAEASPALAATCRIKQAKPQALALALAVADDPTSSADSVARARSEVGKIMARCIEEAAQLPAMGCP